MNPSAQAPSREPGNSPHLRLGLSCGDPASCDTLLGERPHLISIDAVTIPREALQRMKAAVAAVERVVSLPAYRDRTLRHAAGIARFDPGILGVFIGYDFHLQDGQPQLIEINTNAGGGMINAVLAQPAEAPLDDLQPYEDRYLAMFRAEWRRQRGDRPLHSIAIVDDQPAGQYLYPEFLLFRAVFRRHGLDARIVDAADLSYREGRLRDGNHPIDLVYNRLTDFMLDEPRHAALRAACLDGAVVLTPNPRAHALYANKRNLTLLSHPHLLHELGVAAEDVATLAAGVPATVEVTPELGDMLWNGRRELFFKPAAGFGSKAVYRGDKLTRRVWQEILAGDYVAQKFIPPGRRANRHGEDLKEDFRLYVYAGETQLIAARLYRGQTTNFRTPTGGFAPVRVTD